jgi:hypothetical protein
MNQEVELLTRKMNLTANAATTADILQRESVMAFTSAIALDESAPLSIRQRAKAALVSDVTPGKKQAATLEKIQDKLDLASIKTKEATDKVNSILQQMVTKEDLRKAQNSIFYYLLIAYVATVASVAYLLA